MILFNPDLFYIKWWCDVILIQVICRNSSHIPITLVPVMWRHNFNTGFVAAILNVLVKF